jgi:hypothetical protein
MAISPTVILGLLDSIDASYRTSDAALRLTSVQGMPAKLGTVIDVATMGLVHDLNDSINAVLAAAQPDAINGGIYTNFFNKLAQEISGLAISGVTNLNQYATYQNTASAHSFLIAPNSGSLFYLSVSRKPALILSAGNVFAPKTTLGTATVGAAGVVTFTAGSTILQASDTTLGIQGYAPPTTVLITGTTLINGTLTVTITYSGQTSAGGAVSNHTVNAVIDNLAVNATVSVTMPSSERIASISAIAKNGSPTATAGAFSISTVLERVTV